MNKKGSALDILVIVMMFVFMTGVVFLISWKAITMIKTVADTQVDPGGQALLQKVYNNYKILDWLFVFLFVIMILMAIIFSYFIKTHPAMFFIALILDVVIIVMTNIIQQIFTNMASMDLFTGITSLFPFTNFLISNLTIVITVIVILQGVVMYGALRSDVL